MHQAGEHRLGTAHAPQLRHSSRPARTALRGGSGCPLLLLLAPSRCRRPPLALAFAPCEQEAHPLRPLAARPPPPRSTRRLEHALEAQRPPPPRRQDEAASSAQDGASSPSLPSPGVALELTSPSSQTRCILPTLPPDLLLRTFRLDRAISFDNFLLSKALLPHTLAALASGVDLLDIETFTSFCLALRRRPFLVDAVERLQLAFTSGFFPDNDDDDDDESAHSDSAVRGSSGGDEWVEDLERESAGQLGRNREELEARKGALDALVSASLGRLGTDELPLARSQIPSTTSCASGPTSSRTCAASSTA